MTGVKRVLAMLLVFMTILSCNITGFAATKPTAKLTDYPATVTRGKQTQKFYFRLRAGSYAYKSNFYRAGIAAGWTKGMTTAQSKTFITKTPKNNIVGFAKSCDDFRFTYMLPKDMKTGKWKFVYAAFYRSKDSLSAWTINKDCIRMVTITVK